MVGTRWQHITVMLNAFLAAGGLSTPAQAHPHVWITTQTTVLYDNGTFVGLRHKWIFDELYSATAVEGLDKNGDGKYDRDELAELAKADVEGLHEFVLFYLRLSGGAKTRDRRSP